MNADVDVVIAGGGPAGLMLASELRLGGAGTVVLERLPAPTGLSKALGLLGRAVQTLDYRGLLGRFGAGVVPAAAYSRFAHLGGIPLDVSRLLDAAPPGHFPPPLPALQAQVEQVLEERARELGAEIRRGHELAGLSQDEETVTVEVAGPGGSYRLRRCPQRGPQAGRHRVSRYPADPHAPARGRHAGRGRPEPAAAGDHADGD